MNKKIALLGLIFLLSVVNNSSMAGECFWKHYKQINQVYIVSPSYSNIVQPQTVNYAYPVPAVYYAPVIVQERRLVPIVENRLSYVPVFTGYGYYPVNNYYNPWATYRY